MDGPRLVMVGNIVVEPADSEPNSATGPPVDIGLDGATYVNDDEGAIAIPLDGGRRTIFPAGTGSPTMRSR